MSSSSPKGENSSLTGFPPAGPSSCSSSWRRSWPCEVSSERKATVPGAPVRSEPVSDQEASAYIAARARVVGDRRTSMPELITRSEEHTSELQSRGHLVCRLLLEKQQRD